MTLVLHIANDFGEHLADGFAAAQYRALRINPSLSNLQTLTLDFTGVRNANSSFVNALVSGLIEEHGEELLEKTIFKGCNPVIRVLVESAIDLGLQKRAERTAQS